MLPLSSSRQLFFGTNGGDLFVNGNVNTAQLTVNGGAGRLVHPSGTSVSTSGTSYINTTEVVTIAQPCTACDPSTAIDIGGFISAFEDSNDN